METPRWHGYAVDKEAGFVFRFTSDYKTRKSVERNMDRCFSQAVARPVFARNARVFRVDQEVSDMDEVLESIARDANAEDGTPELEIIECEVTRAFDEEPEITPLAYMSPMEQLSEIAALELTFDDLKFDNNGYNVWVSGNTKGHKELLQALGFKYAPKRKAWWFRAPKQVA